MINDIHRSFLKSTGEIESKSNSLQATQKFRQEPAFQAGSLTHADLKTAKCSSNSDNSKNFIRAPHDAANSVTEKSITWRSERSKFFNGIIPGLLGTAAITLGISLLIYCIQNASTPGDPVK